MADGRLGNAILSASSPTTLYVVPPAAKYAAVNVHCYNSGTTVATIDLYLATTNNPTTIDSHTQSVLEPHADSDDTSLVLSANEFVIIKSDSNAVVASVRGTEVY
jgi:hypothetical protein